MTMEIANTILKQLGGNKFIIMTGAKNLVGTEKGLQFRIMKNATKINHVTIELTSMDTYDVTFKRIYGTKVTTISFHECIYCDMLTDLFTAETGLDTSL